ncbi:TRAP transporter fused permease subunit [Roseibacterium sp. SDUM158017]|uniref:TRAP transporter permease n=1 Tax=Roseicyclus salinarum TaxID=3036773 RepID=UPI00241553AE|nr:TRAP transporter fused permease subunit [Roseibacterium sp. SDUM158017]MDG4647177.1 TRAP transporter fused permease subunit [Roseibacterium sp. SDUM158017]
MTQRDSERSREDLEAEAQVGEGLVVADGVDEEPVESNRRLFAGRSYLAIAALSTIYAAFHMLALNGVSISDWTGIEIPFLPQFPMETWNFRIVHISGALALGFLLFSAHTFSDDGPAGRETRIITLVAAALAIPALVAGATAIGFVRTIAAGDLPQMGGLTTWAAFPGTEIYETEVRWFGIPLLLATFGAIATGWFERRERHLFTASDIVLALCGIVVAIYLVAIYGTAARNSVGTPFVPIGVAFAATAGSALILELTRRVAGLALVVITGVFLVYTFTAHLLPGILAVQTPYTWQRFFGHVYSDAGILGPTTAVSSTYIILFIIFAAFLQASKVGDYFVNFAFAAAGRARGGPAKVAIFASGLMGMINGTSAGNVVATGSLTIPLMKKVGYQKKTAGAIEAAASTGGQIMPPIMGAGAFIMAEITGIPYQEIAIAAIIPAILYFVSIFFMVDFEAAKLGMRGMREDELPKLRAMARRVFLFIPIIILIVALFQGYSVIRAGTLATIAAVVVSWMQPTWRGWGLLALSIAIYAALTTLLSEAAATQTGTIAIFAVALAGLVYWTYAYRGDGMTPGKVLKAFELAGVMSIQIIAVCACAGIIVGVISLTGVGARFSNVLLDLAGVSQILALFFAMCIAILLGMGMPTTAAYAVAASVVAPGLVQLGIPMLTAHFFVFYFAVVSAITPPVALASYAAAGISGANPMETSVASFKIGIAAFIVPFMFFYNSAILMDGTWFEVIRAGLTATFGVFLLSAGVQGWFIGGRTAWFLRIALVIAALFMIEGGLLTDLAGIGAAAGIFMIQKVFQPRPDASVPVRGAD